MRLKSVLLIVFATLCLCSNPWTSHHAHARGADPGPGAGEPAKSKKKTSKKKKSRKKSKRGRGRRVKYTVVPGDSLHTIAKAHGVKVARIRAWNKLEGNNIGVGKTLTIYTKRHVRSRHKTLYTIKKGDTLAKIAKKFKVKTGDILAWNPRVHPKKIRPGKKIRIYAWGAGSSSNGSANSGNLLNGVAMSDGRGYRVRTTHRAYGTDKTVRLIGKCISATKKKFPKAKKLMIGDISVKNGGYLRPHKSHQSGRDADISYYIKKQDTSFRFVNARAKTLDVPKTWHLFKRFIDTKEVEYIFVDYPLQKVLYEYAKKKGSSAAYLDRVFQYPKGRGSQRGIIRYSRGHDDHFHIRFKCDKGSKGCK